MSISTPPKGSHFGDGVRTGVQLNSQFTQGANALSVATQVFSPNDGQAPGVFNTPLTLLDFIPTPVNPTALFTATAPLGGAGYYTFTPTANTLGVTVMTSYQGVNPKAPNTFIVKLDVPRNISITSTGNDSAHTVNVYGWDQYGSFMVETITGPNSTIAFGKKAFLYVLGIYAPAVMTGNISAGVGNTFGLGHLCPNTNYIGVPEWGGVPDAPISVLLGNNPIATNNATPTITVTVPTTVGLAVGQYIRISGATTYEGIAIGALNISAKILTIPGATTFTYNAETNATGTGAGGGGANVILSYTAGQFVRGDQAPATATTGDVRGTYTPFGNADGTQRLTINYYNPTADSRTYYNAVTGAVILNANPLSTTNVQNYITVYAPNHQFTTGENVTISGGTGTIATITAGNYNITAPVTVVDNNNFTYVNASGANANATASGGGTVVLMTPGRGNLNQLPVGRYGVPQYIVAAP